MPSLKNPFYHFYFQDCIKTQEQLGTYLLHRGPQMSGRACGVSACCCDVWATWRENVQWNRVVSRRLNPTSVYLVPAVPFAAREIEKGLWLYRGRFTIGDFLHCMTARWRYNRIIAACTLTQGLHSINGSHKFCIKFVQFLQMHENGIWLHLTTY